MNLSYLPLLASGIVPDNDVQYQNLDNARKKKVSEFVKRITKNYNIEDINHDIEKLTTMTDSIIYKIVDKFQIIFVLVSVFFFVLYWIMFGFGYGLLTGSGVLILLAFLDKRLGGLFGLSQSSTQLLNDFDSLVSDLYAAMKKEQKRAK